MTFGERAPYGSLLKTDRPKKPKKVARLLGRDPREKNPAHLDAIRQCPCLSCGREGVDAAHVRMTTADRINPGMQQKPHDHEAVPLCRDCHTRQHSMSEVVFWNRLKIDPLKIARKLAKHSPSVDAMRAVVFAVRALVALGRDARGMKPC
jgi:hypothetical protein